MDDCSLYGPLVPAVTSFDFMFVVFLNAVGLTAVVIMFGILLKAKREFLLLQKQIIILIELTKKVIDSNLVTQRGTQRLVTQVPSQVAGAVERALYDIGSGGSGVGLERKSDPPLTHPLKLRTPQTPGE